MTTTKKLYTTCSPLVATNNLEYEGFPGPMPDLNVIRCRPRYGAFRNAVDFIDDITDLEICAGEPGNRANLYYARREGLWAQIKMIFYKGRDWLRDSVLQGRDLIGQTSGTPAAWILLAWVELGSFE